MDASGPRAVRSVDRGRADVPRENATCDRRLCSVLAVHSAGLAGEAGRSSCASVAGDRAILDERGSTATDDAPGSAAVRSGIRRATVLPSTRHAVTFAFDWFSSMPPVPAAPPGPPMLFWIRQDWMIGDAALIRIPPGCSKAPTPPLIVNPSRRVALFGPPRCERRDPRPIRGAS